MSHLIQEQPTLEMASVGLATQATSNSKRSFSMVLIMLSYRMSEEGAQQISLNTIAKEGAAKETSLSDKKINIHGEYMYIII